MIKVRPITYRALSKPMSHSSTVLSQFLKMISKSEFHSLAERYHVGQRFRVYSRFDQFVMLLTLQITGRSSIRDVVANTKVQMVKLLAIGAKAITRSSFSRMNKEQDWQLYEALFYKLYNRCQPISSKHRFKFKSKLYSLDSTTIDLCLSLFPWAQFRQTKGAVKLHTVLDHGDERVRTQMVTRRQSKSNSSYSGRDHSPPNVWQRSVRPSANAPLCLL